jgi:hypothetical protein
MNLQINMTQLFKKLLLFCGVFTLLGVCISLVMFWGFWEKSGYSNCVIVSDESRFIGERLKYSQALSHGKKTDQECISDDLKLDSGNGPLVGKVRWVECLKGPDCDEAGMF